MKELYISVRDLKNHFSWWNDNNEYKKIFNDIIDCQPTVELERSGKEVACPECGKKL